MNEFMSKKAEANPTTPLPNDTTLPTPAPPATPQTTEPETTPKKVAPPPPAALPAQAPTTQSPTHTTTIITTTGPVANANNMIGSCDEKYATLFGGGKVILLMSNIIASGSPLTIHAKGGGSNCYLYVYSGTSSAGPWTLLSAHIINSENWTKYISNTATNDQHIALAVTGENWVDIDYITTT
jgi:hypothetical protein